MNLYCCLVAALLNMHSSSETVSVEELRRSNQTSITAIQTAVVSYQQFVTRVPINRLPEGTYTDVADEVREQALQTLNLTRDATDECTAIVSVTDQVWTLDCDDVRDLDSLLPAAGLSEDHRMNVSRTRVELQGRKIVGHFLPEAKHLIINDRRRVSVDQNHIVLSSPLETGCYSNSFFQAGVDTFIQPVMLGQEKTVLFTVNTPSAEYLLYLDPRLGYRYRMIEVYLPNGTLVERQVASDYRFVDGIPYPFRHETERWNRLGEFSEQSVIVVTDVSLNSKLPEGSLDLAIPGGTWVHDLRRATRDRSFEEMYVKPSNLADLIDHLRQMRRRATEENGSNGRKGSEVSKAQREPGVHGIGSPAKPGNVSAQVEIDPAVLYCGSVATRPAFGSVASQPALIESYEDRLVLVRTIRPKDLHLVHVESDESAFDLQIEEQTPGRKYLIRVSMPPGYVPPQTGRAITVMTDDPGFPLFRIPVLTNWPAGELPVPGYVDETR